MTRQPLPDQPKPVKNSLPSVIDLKVLGQDASISCWKEGNRHFEAGRKYVHAVRNRRKLLVGSRDETPLASILR